MLNAFSNCSQLQGFTVDAGNPSFAADDQGCLWSKDFSTLHIIPPSVSLVTLKPASQIGFFPQNAQCGLYGSSIGASSHQSSPVCYMRVTADGYLCDAGEILMGVGGKILAPGSKGSKFGITAILFPRGVTIIDGGFSGFPSLETVVLPETLELLDGASIERANADAFTELIESFEEETPENIVGFVDKYIVDTKDRLDMDIGPRKSKAQIPDSKLASLKYQKVLDDIRPAIKAKLPPTLESNPRIDAAITELERVICDEAYTARRAYLEGPFFQNTFVDLFVAKKNSMNNAQSERTKQIELFDSTFQQKTLGIRKRVALVRALIAVCDGFVTHYEEHDFANGEKANAFKFMRELYVEYPIDFMIRTINARTLNLQGIGKCNPENLWEYIKAFCFSEDGYRKGSDWEQLYDDLIAFGLTYEEKSSICFDSGDGTYQDIRKLSPGTQTNILIEYIVHKKTKIPLLIDQPEDNVDNQTIYSKIRSWFMGLKQSRQVIVVTHDANIVINADAENVIIAEQPHQGEFAYQYGALEYGDIIDQASLILDGGKDAVKRRLVKYGE